MRSATQSRLAAAEKNRRARDSEDSPRRNSRSASRSSGRTGRTCTVEPSRRATSASRSCGYGVGSVTGPILERLGGREVKTLGKFRGGGVESSVRSTSADIGLTSHFRGGGPARERSGTSAQRTAAVGLTTAGPWLSSL